MLSSIDGSVVHELNGGRGTYSLLSGCLHIDWNDVPSEDFIEIDGVYTHYSLVQDTITLPPAVACHQPTIQVVSLRRTPERRTRFATLNHGLDFAFFDAIDGWAVDRARFLESGFAEQDLVLSTGAIGCALSHLALWEKSIREQVTLTIVEDDAVLRQDFQTKSRQVIAALPPGWDLIMWGWNFDSILSVNVMPGVSPIVMIFDQNKLRQSIDRFCHTLWDVVVFELDKCFGACAYSISPQGSLKFKQNCFPLKNEGVFFPGLNRVLPNDGIDIEMNRIYPLTNTYVSFPPLAVTPNLRSESLTVVR